MEETISGLSGGQRRLVASVLCAFTAFALAAHSAFADIGEAFGFGGRTQALAGAGVAWGNDGFAGYSNPALLPIASGDANRRLVFSFGLLDMTPNIMPINNIIIHTSFDSDNTVGSPTLGNADTDYRTTFGEELGVSYNLFPDFHNLTVGLVVFLPVAQLALVDTGSAYQPEFLLYRANTQRPQIEFGVGGDLGEGFRLGAGITTGFSLTANGTVFLKTTSNQPSTMRFSSSIKPQLGPYFGLNYTPVDDPSRYSFGATVRLPITYSSVIAFSSDAQFFGGTGAIPFTFSASSALYYDPLNISIGGSVKHSEVFRTYAQLDWEAYSKYSPPALQIGNPSLTCNPGPCSTSISPSLPIPANFVDIFVPRIAEEINVSSWLVARAGYSYHPSILQSIPNGAGNFLDPPKHSISVGTGFKFLHFLAYNVPSSIDLALEYQALVSQTIVKTPGDENGAINTDPKIGSPGYQAGGNVVGGTLSMSVAF